MRSLFLILPLLSALSIAQKTKCEDNCPQVKCPGNDAVALCQCLNNRERMCKEKCPEYTAEFLPCPISPNTTTIAVPKPTAKCECEQEYCLMIWPGSCHCANDAAKRCYDKCGGEPPKLNVCPDSEVSVRSAEVESAPAPAPEAVIEIQSLQDTEPVKDCVCEEVYCIAMYPQGCYCQNAGKVKCHQKCGGRAPTLDKCPPVVVPTLATTTAPIPTTTVEATPLPTNATHKVCGGGRANYMLCDEGYYCMNDPYTPGCGPACDGLGICVKDKMCGGFAGFKCEAEGQVCHDDPRDDCDPKDGGFDCGGLCVWPHKSLYGEEE